MRVAALGAVSLLASGTLHAQQLQLSDETRRYVSVDAPVIAIRHVRVIDGTGAQPRDDQTIVISGGLKVTGHLCSVTFREAAALGIDDLEHGLVVSSDFVRGDPVTRIQDIENAELVFKDGVGYDSPRLFDAARGAVGLH